MELPSRSAETPDQNGGVSGPKAFTLLAQGSEGRIYKGQLFGVPCVIKERFVRRYRHPTLDHELTSQRLIAEARTMVRGRKYGIDCPVLYFVDRDARKIYMEHIEGVSLKQFLDVELRRVSLGADEFDGRPISGLEKASNILETLPEAIGRSIAKLHNCGIIHGDITPSNIMLRYRNENGPQGEEQGPAYNVALIDFGLSYASVMAEDKAVDLYVVERALKPYEAALPRFVTDMITDGYLQAAVKPESIRRKLNEVRQRGRKRLAIG